LNCLDRWQSGSPGRKGKTELYLKNEGALEDYLLDSVCRETVLNRRANDHLAHLLRAPRGAALLAGLQGSCPRRRRVASEWQTSIGHVRERMSAEGDSVLMLRFALTGGALCGRMRACDTQ
jgi:hypothetical protein